MTELLLPPAGPVVPGCVGPVCLGVGEPPLGHEPGQASRGRLHHQVVPDRPVLQRKYFTSNDNIREQNMLTSFGLSWLSVDLVRSEGLDLLAGD